MEHFQGQAGRKEPNSKCEIIFKVRLGEIPRLLSAFLHQKVFKTLNFKGNFVEARVTRSLIFISRHDQEGF